MQTNNARWKCYTILLLLLLAGFMAKAESNVQTCPHPQGYIIAVFILGMAFMGCILVIAFILLAVATAQSERFEKTQNNH